MLTITAKASTAAHFISCGNLINEDSFLHINRTLSEFVFILVQEGVLSIFANGKKHQIQPGEFLFLLPGQNHYGLVPSKGRISYYWTHFTLEESGIKDILTFSDTQSSSDLLSESLYLLPEAGTLSDNGRTQLLFIQLLDIAKRNGFRADFQCNYALSTLLLELSGEVRRKILIQRQGHPNPTFSDGTNSLSDPGTPLAPRIADLVEWLKLNYDTPLSVAEIAKRFGYHPAYLTSVFRQATGQTIIAYLHRERIQAAARLLLTPPRQTLTEISEAVGFADEKYFMKLFKRYEGMTPTAYRNAFSGKEMNRS